MADFSQPTDPYPLDEWKKKPCAAQGDEDLRFDKYKYKNGENLESIARIMSKPWKELTATDLAVFNWGHGAISDVNWYLRNHNGCRKERGTYMVLGTTDTNAFLWVPRLPYTGRGLYRSPGKTDVGHVTLDDTKTKTAINTLVVKPVYAIRLELGDVDALFDPISESGKKPWECKGVQQRLQVLGYLYAPIGPPTAHAHLDGITEKVWENYKKVHGDTNRPPLSNPAALAKLKVEIQSNLIAVRDVNTSPTPGMLLEGRLPACGRPEIPAEGGGPGRPAMPPEFAAIRLPGGYTITKSAWNGSLYDNANYQYDLGHNRDEIEDDVLKNNVVMHKIPLVATVHRVHPDGRIEPAEGVSVHFQLVPPDAMPDDCPLKAPDPRGTEMDYGKNCAAAEVSEIQGVSANSLPWATVQAIARANKDTADVGARDTAVGNAVDAAIAAAGVPAPDRAAAIADVDYYIGEALANVGPFEVADAGPKKFVTETFDNQPALTGPDATTDPQKDNIDKKYGGKRGLPVHGEGAGANLKLGVFEITKARKGLHSRRDDTHADYGAMTPARKATVVAEDDGAGTTVRKHVHAVRATTNGKGHAGVMFTPSRCGGDSYKIRAYVGPPTLDFAGLDAEGPVVTTGTMVVWRNIRLHQYVQLDHGTRAGTHADVRRIFGASDVKFNNVWNNQGYDSGIPDVDLSEAGGLDQIPKSGSGRFGNAYYRSVDHTALSLVQQYRRAYCELIVEQTNRQARKVKYDEFKTALDDAKQKMTASNWMGKVIDWDELLICRPDTVDATKIGSPFLFTVRHPNHYNAIVNAPGYAGPGQPLAVGDYGNVRLTIGFVAGYAIMQYFSGDAAVGLSIVQSMGADNWDDGGTLTGATGDDVIATSGLAGGGRACLLSYSSDTYQDFCYSVTCNAAHELGHALTRPHQATNPGSDADAHEIQGTPGTTPVPAAPPGGMCTCVMSYVGCYGEYCGRCLLALRGLKAKSGTCADGA